jgi:hypothetical protein
VAARSAFPPPPLTLPGIGRLEDESQLVVRAALRLLFSCVQNNPFAPQLSTERFTATLAHLEQQLEAMGPDPDAARGGEEGAGGSGGEGGDAEVGQRLRVGEQGRG